MTFQPWHLQALEEYGYTDTNEGLLNRVARALSRSPNDTIETDEFRRTCIACNVDPDSFTQSDFEYLQERLNQIT